VVISRASLSHLNETSRSSYTVRTPRGANIFSQHLQH
jgi:hypothetical protein